VLLCIVHTLKNKCSDDSTAIIAIEIRRFALVAMILLIGNNRVVVTAIHRIKTK
jgi:hypothetical protein